MNAAVAFIKFPGAAGAVAGIGGYGLSVCETMKPYLQDASLIVGITCGVITIVEYIARKLEKRGEDGAVRKFVEEHQDDVDL